MKKRIFFLLTAILCLGLLASCGEKTEDPSPIGEETEPVETAKPEETAPPMDENAIRQTVYDYMVEAANVEWTPKVNFDLSTSSKYVSGLAYKAGRTYHGAPYENDIDGDMEGFKALLENGVYVGPTALGEAYGCDCSSAVAAAIRAYNPDSRIAKTNDMFPNAGYGCMPVGFYDYTTVKDHLTTKITEASGEQEMYEAYALVQKSDIVLTRWNSGAAHVRLVSGEATVVRNPDGTINGDRSYILYCDQTSTIREFDGYLSNWQIDAKATFKSLFNNWFIPVCLKEFYVNHTQELLFTVNGINKPEKFPERLTGQITCSQKIKDAKVSILDESGKEIYAEEKKEFRHYCLTLSSFSFPELNKAVSAAGSGKYTYVVSVWTFGTDDYVEVTKFDFTKA